MTYSKESPKIDIKTIQHLKLYIFCMSFVMVSCNSKSDNSKSYFDTKLNSSQGVEILLKEITLDEKFGQMCQYVDEPTDNALNNKDEEVKNAVGFGERADLIKQGKIGS